MSDLDIRILKESEMRDADYFTLATPQWQDDSSLGSVDLFFEPDIFDMIEPIIEKHAPMYYRYDGAELYENELILIISDLGVAHKAILKCKNSVDCMDVLNLSGKEKDNAYEDAVYAKRGDVAKLLKNVAAWLSHRHEHGQSVTVGYIDGP